MRLAAAVGFACVLLVSRPATATYDPPSFSQCVFDSHVIVVGRIETLRDTDYDLRVEDWIAGANPAATLRVQRFKDWTCARREPAYATGQRLVAFLGRGDDGFFTVGGGCEGDVVLEDGVALMTVLPGGFGGWESPVPGSRFVEGVRALRAGFRGVKEPDFAEAWRALLTHPEPLVVATAIEWLDPRSSGGSVKSYQFTSELLAAMENPQRKVRLFAAGRIGDMLAPVRRPAIEEQLSVTARTGRPELRPAAALARLSIRPADVERHAEAVALLADESVPLEERDALAIALDRWPHGIPRKLDLARVDAAARDALPRIDDPSLLLHFCRYIDRLHEEPSYPRPKDAEAERAKWLKRLDPRSGDAEPPWTWIAIAVVSGAAVAGVAAVIRSRRKSAA